MKKYLKIIGIVLVVAALFVLAKHFNVQEHLKNILDHIKNLGPTGYVVFVVVYIVCSVLLIPASVLTLGAGAVYGIVKGTILVSMASILAAAAAFLIGRFLARDWVNKKIEGNKNFKAIDEAVGKEGWKIVGLTRLSPVFPFTILNYAFGLTKVSFKGYFFASWIGMLPGTMMYVYLGSAATTLTGASGAKTPEEKALFIVGLVATVIVTIFVTRVAKKALASKTS